MQALVFPLRGILLEMIAEVGITEDLESLAIPAGDQLDAKTKMC